MLAIPNTYYGTQRPAFYSGMKIEPIQKRTNFPPAAQRSIAYWRGRCIEAAGDMKALCYASVMLSAVIESIEFPQQGALQ